MNPYLLIVPKMNPYLLIEPKMNHIYFDCGKSLENTHRRPWFCHGDHVFVERRKKFGPRNSGHGPSRRRIG